MEILEINENTVRISYNNLNNTKLLNNYLIFKDEKVIIGEIIKVQKNELFVNLVGEIINNNFIYGINTKPSFNSEISIINPNLISNILSYPNDYNGLHLGIYTPLNNNIYMNLTNFFNSHFAIMGSTGSGKSCALATIIQTLFQDREYIPYKSHFFLFDTYGEYQNSFLNIEKNNSFIKYKIYTTDLQSKDEILKIPTYLLDVDDLALLLNAESANQVQIISKALELVNIFKNNSDDLKQIKNNIISRAILDILLSGRPAFQIRDQILSILTFYKTAELNLETQITQPGYNRSLKNCLLIDADNKLREMELLTNFFSNYLIDDISNEIKLNKCNYTLKDLEDAIDFALISEGIFKSEKVYDNNNILRVRIHNLLESEYSKYFDYDELISKEEYIKILTTKDNNNVQLVNFNINYVDDRFAKNIVKILSKMLFNTVKNLEPRGSSPFHIILEEAHRYVINDADTTILGYNIFDRIAKEGRKYGIFLGLITQRPSELSDTVLSQCNNFLIFKISQPSDSNYIRNIIPFMTDEISERIKMLQPGNCYIFGPAFKIPIVIKIKIPNPTPNSNNVNILNTWFVKKK